MAASKRKGCLGLVASAVLSGIVAPVLVNVASQELQKADFVSLAGELAQPASPASPLVPPPNPPDHICPVVAQGEGETPEEALRDALRHALTGAGETRPCPKAHVASFKDLACGIERRSGRNVYRRQVEVIVARHASEDGIGGPANASGWSWSFAGR